MTQEELDQCDTLMGKRSFYRNNINTDILTYSGKRGYRNQYMMTVRFNKEKKEIVCETQENRFQYTNRFMPNYMKYKDLVAVVKTAKIIFTSED